jgi:hypothetical protein
MKNLTDKNNEKVFFGPNQTEINIDTLSVLYPELDTIE